MKQKMVIVIAPSGGGKSTFLRKLLADIDQLRTTVTYTTRSMRKGESEGRPYHFVSTDRFKELREQSFFAEWAIVHDNFYGTPVSQIHEIWTNEKAVVMDVDVQGADSLKTLFPQALTIFIMPPSIQELRRRVIEREGKEPEDLELRMKNAGLEIDRAQSFDRQVVNDQFDNSYLEFKKVVEEYLKSS